MKCGPKLSVSCKGGEKSQELTSKKERRRGKEKVQLLPVVAWTLLDFASAKRQSASQLRHLLVSRICFFFFSSSSLFFFFIFLRQKQKDKCETLGQKPLAHFNILVYTFFFLLLYLYGTTSIPILPNKKGKLNTKRTKRNPKPQTSTLSFFFFCCWPPFLSLPALS